MMSKQTKKTDREAELRQAFKVFDADNSGSINIDELRTVMKSIGENLSEQEIEQMLKLADTNGDGTIDCK